MKIRNIFIQVLASLILLSPVVGKAFDQDRVDTIILASARLGVLKTLYDGKPLVADWELLEISETIEEPFPSYESMEALMGLFSYPHYISGERALPDELLENVVKYLERHVDRRDLELGISVYNRTTGVHRARLNQLGFDGVVEFARTRLAGERYSVRYQQIHGLSGSEQILGQQLKSQWRRLGRMEEAQKLPDNVIPLFGKCSSALRQ